MGAPTILRSSTLFRPGGCTPILRIGVTHPHASMYTPLCGEALRLRLAHT
nr:MAG TPA: hypothetical protein [Caudoviricetes sp.]